MDRRGSLIRVDMTTDKDIHTERKQERLQDGSQAFSVVTAGAPLELCKVSVEKKKNRNDGKSRP